MSDAQNRRTSTCVQHPRRWALLALVSVLVVGGAAAIYGWPQWRQLVAAGPACCEADDAHAPHGPAESSPVPTAEQPQHDHDDHSAAQEASHTRAVQGQPEGDLAGHTDEDHPPHAAGGTLELSAAAARNVGLTLCEVRLQDFSRSLAIPAVVIERPGRSEIVVSAPMTGIVTRIFPLAGAAVAPGDALCEVRLTHEDLVEKQSDFLRDLEQLDVINQEVNRLEDVARSGAVPGRRLLEPMYEKQKLEGAMRAEREALLLHGLTAEQIGTIERERQLVKTIVIHAPDLDDSHPDAAHEDFFQVSELAVKPGAHVATGTPLMTLTDHCELYIEGRAFEQDAEVLSGAISQQRPVSALIESAARDKQELGGLQILYVDGTVDPESRALKCYVRLQNELLRDESTPDGHRFVSWRYRPGQRMELLVPAETWEDRIVLPVEAVISEGPNWYVYQKHGDHFDRVAVHVEHRDRRGVVIARDGALQPGDVVAARGAYQLHLALQHAAGGGIDPHAGHNH